MEATKCQHCPNRESRSRLFSCKDCGAHQCDNCAGRDMWGRVCYKKDCKGSLYDEGRIR